MKKFICITGGGGKTTCMQKLARQYRESGLKVLMTTSVKIQSPEVYSWQADSVFTSKEDVLSFKPEKPVIVLYAEKYNEAKLCSPEESTFQLLASVYDIIICEADGSRGKPLKIHTEKDPVIPSLCTDTISVIGAWAIGCKARDAVFGDDSDKIVDSNYIQSYINDNQGLMKGSIKYHRAVLITGFCNLTAKNADIFRNIQWPDDCDIIYS